MEARVDAGSTGEMHLLPIRRVGFGEQVESTVPWMREDRALCERDAPSRPQNRKE